MTTPVGFDALRAVLDAPVLKRVIPDEIWTPPPTDGNPAPGPVTIPGRTVLEVDHEALPGDVQPPDGQLDLATQVALLHEAIRRTRAIQLRAVHAQATFTNNVPWNVGTRTVALTWSTTPLAAVEAALARMDVGVAWQGRVSARVDPGSITATGCTVLVAVTATVVPTASQPITVHADGIYTYLPPYEES